MPPAVNVVEQNDKQRFTFDADGTRVRANPGHLIKIDLGLAPIALPECLHHGIATRFVEAIRQTDLLHGKYDYVHLSLDEATAL